MWWIFAIILLVFILFIKKSEKKETENKVANKEYTEQQKESNNSASTESYSGKYKSKKMLTKNEWSAYMVMKKITDAHELVICPKVRLIDIVEPKPCNEEYTLRAKVIQKHVDFVICNKNLQIIGIVELDDSSHDTTKRKERDKFVDEILTDVGYIVIHTRYINENTLDPIIEKTKN